MTRPNISFDVQHLSQFMHAPKKSHYDAALHVVRYIKKQPGLGLLMSSRTSGKITTFCDADWAFCLLSRKSVTGFGIKFDDSLVSWKSKKQSTMSKSSAEAEYRSMATTVAELVWLQGLLQELGATVELPMDIERIFEGLIRTEYVASKEQMADIFTKALGKQLHNDMLFKLGLVDIFKDPT
ncbi:uncharacterized mitochondrial protein AtMg00810-like [Lycium barbarum]|uniref:uncharacterized mitochondrial protein AtMg00810-like n=1 Tax=Lycium barbarum TaxID=112863 RepID=UPI00293F4CFA|nr:uncharacterized mitochondrial protein AtMg00810-like [Lycium barbarum]